MSDQIKEARQARDFPKNTCPASRHLQIIGEALYRGEPYPMLTDEPEHCGGSMLATVTALYETRTERDKLRAAVTALADGLRHMEHCAVCASDSWYECEGGRDALAALRLADETMGERAA